ncbi:MAG: PAS domain-containing sensor histidine kinase [Holosporaceae bacterium]|jgi:signal transduction histidine kinase|nr:PAS domain-containing sensor histidine kinase [Holosporaceae bacterium]
MTTERYVRWAKEADEFWKTARDGDVVLDVVVSYSCKSQSGEGFEELVNSINNNPLRKKIKKVNITDTSYLYRHTIPEFESYSDPEILTEWFLVNKNSIEKLSIDYDVIPWVIGFEDVAFENWLKQMKIDFAGDELGSGLSPQFRQLVLSEAEKAVLKGNGTFEKCVNFILEECAYTCLHFKGAVMAYPTKLSPPIAFAIRRYETNVHHLPYTMSNNAQRHRHRSFDRNEINYEIINFITRIATNVNFFVIDRHGNIIYKNESLGKVVSERNAAALNPDTWSNSVKVMESKTQIVREENDKGRTFLSVKSPLIIDNEVEGVIGLAIDITDRKKLEEFEKQKALQILAESVAHDISSPLSILSMISRSRSLPESEYIALRNAIIGIEQISGKLLLQCRENLRAANSEKEHYILVGLSLLEILKEKRCRYVDSDVEFNCLFSDDDRTFIKGDYSSFCRMLSNIIDNAVDAVGEGHGVITINLSAKNREVEIHIKDNGKGMLRDVVDKVMGGTGITTKEDGHGLGMRQVLGAVEEMNGRISVKTEENVGTEFILTFPECDAPSWFSDEIVLHDGDTVVILDDDSSIFEAWRRYFLPHKDRVDVRYLTDGQETIDFINSFGEKDNVFLITDYELRGQTLNGVDVIEQTDRQARNLIVTSVYTSKIENFGEKCDIFKLFPKMAGVEKISLIFKDKSTTTG